MTSATFLYAVWCIGEMLLAMGGLDLTSRVLCMSEDGIAEGRSGSWLDHRHDGVTNVIERWDA